MKLSALIMFLIGAVMLWCGLFVCLRIALKNRNNDDGFNEG